MIDRDAIFTVLPPPALFAAMDPGLRRTCAGDAIAATLDGIEHELREPDGWEAWALQEALDCLAAGDADGALQGCAQALKRDGERPTCASVTRTDDPPPTVQQLRVALGRALAGVRA